MAKKLLTLLFAGLSACSLVKPIAPVIPASLMAKVVKAVDAGAAAVAAKEAAAIVPGKASLWSLASATDKANALSAGYFSTIFGVPAAATAWMFGSEAAKDGGRINMLQEALSESTKPAAVVEQVKELTRMEKLTSALTSVGSKVVEGVNYVSTVAKNNKAITAVAATALAGTAAMALKGKVASKAPRLSVEELVKDSNGNMDLARKLRLNGYKADDLNGSDLPGFSKEYILSQLPA